MKYLVTGDHPTAKRPDKTFLRFDLAFNYSETLIEAGYENVKIDPMTMTFDEWWSTYKIVKTDLQPIMKEAFKEIAKDAWDANEKQHPGPAVGE